MAEEKKSGVWVKVVSSAQWAIGRAFKIEFSGVDVDDLCNAVKNVVKLDLDHCDASKLQVFCAGTTLEDWKVEAKALDPGAAVNTLAVTTSKTALIVVAPPAPSQGMYVLCACTLSRTTAATTFMSFSALPPRPCPLGHAVLPFVLPYPAMHCHDVLRCLVICLALCFTCITTCSHETTHLFLLR